MGRFIMDVVAMNARLPVGADALWALILEMDEAGPWTAGQVARRTNLNAGTPRDFIRKLVAGGFAMEVGERIIPAELPPSSISIETGPGRIVIGFVTAPAPSPTRTVKIYANQTGTLDRDADLVTEIAADPGAAYVRALGDPSTVNAFSTPDFSATGAWLATQFTITAGKATKAAGLAGQLTQALAGTTGQKWRLAFTISGYSAGNFQAFLDASPDQTSAAFTSNGTKVATLTAGSTVTGVGFSANSAAAGSIDDAVAFVETPTCLAQGTWYVWLEPVNDDGIAGPVSTLSPVIVP